MGLTANFIPTHLTLTANKGETVHLSMELHSTQKRDVTWKYNGKFTHHCSLHFTHILCCSQERKLCFSADCPSNKWGPYCNQDCPECLNGGVCHDADGDCVCPPGFMGTRCETACREGMFGQNCQESCGSELNCKGLRFCLPDPYGCSCASGWFGSRCEKDRAPQILDLASNLELNLNSSPKILCSATGNPLPNHNSIELRKLDSTVLKVGGPAVAYNTPSTALFEIHRLSAQQSGLWECRVYTNGGQDSRKFNLTIKGQSKQLLVMPVDSHRGDGPIVSTRILYKPVDNRGSWSSIIGEQAELWFSLYLRKQHHQKIIFDFYFIAQQQQKQTFQQLVITTISTHCKISQGYNVLSMFGERNKSLLKFIVKHILNG
uniref:Tyrosine kinase with immunoglobulin-like and EGF-like domains 1 n=1 Tax=Seriola dumerili TaxID=41447 RepID=A0A3B4UL28_SERDU